MVALLYADYVIQRKWEYKKVPKLWRDEVKAILIAEGREDLIDE